MKKRLIDLHSVNDVFGRSQCDREGVQGGGGDAPEGGVRELSACACVCVYVCVRVMEVNNVNVRVGCGCVWGVG